MTPIFTPVLRQEPTAPPTLPAGILNLPPELHVEIALRMRDAQALHSFSQACTRFASLTREPVFMNALTEACVDWHCARIANIDGAEIRAAHIYALAQRLGNRMSPEHLERMMMLLLPKNEAEGMADKQVEAKQKWVFESYNPVPGMQATDFEPQLLTLSRWAVVGAALHSGQIAGLNDAVIRLAKNCMKAGWTDPGLRLGALSVMPVSAIPQPHVALVGDAALGVWRWANDEDSFTDVYGLPRLVIDLLNFCASLPVATKLDVLEKIFGTGQTNVVAVKPCILLRPIETIYDDPQAQAALERSIHCHAIEALHRSAEYPQALDLAQADRFFRILAAVIVDMVTYGYPVEKEHLEFAKMLPALPWRRNSSEGMVWLRSVLYHHQPVLPSLNDMERRDSGRLFFDQCKTLLPQGIFTDRELDYLLTSTADGTFSWEALSAIDPPPSSVENVSASH